MREHRLSGGRPAGVVTLVETPVSRSYARELLDLRAVRDRPAGLPHGGLVSSRPTSIWPVTHVAMHSSRSYVRCCDRRGLLSTQQPPCQR